LSRKHQRALRADRALPAPLRWLTRTLSSITLAIVLLTLIALYGTIASIPVPLMALGLLDAGAGLAAFGLAGAIAWAGWRAAGPRKPRIRAAGLLLAGAGALALTAWGGIAVHRWAAEHPWFHRHSGLVVYRLPILEMTELEFYTWWPMKLLLGLFLANMVWATIRRIAFRFENIGVLSVHTGIVLIALGSLFYGHFKLEGDILLWRRDLGGTPEHVFYDATRPALHFLDEAGEPLLMLPLDALPRYNDAPPSEGGPGIPLHASPAFREVFGPELEATVSGFYAWAELAPGWEAAPRSPDAPPRPAIRLRAGDEAGPDPGARTETLVPAVPAERVLRGPDWALEYLHAPGRARLEALLASHDGPYGLIVEVPEAEFRAVYPVREGQTLEIGDTGYRMHVDRIGPYALPFESPGYGGARDSRAELRIERAGRRWRRLALYRYPERSRDFIPDPTAGPMGRRTAPDPAIRTTFLDNAKLEYHLITGLPGEEGPALIVRLPGRPPALVPLPGGRIRLPAETGPRWLHVTERIAHARRRLRPIPAPWAQRDPGAEGTYVHAALAVDFATRGEGTRWTRRLWMGHMRYPDPRYAEGVRRPRSVHVPGFGRVRIAFSRVRYELPFALALEDFTMEPYPGSSIPRDFISTLAVHPGDGPAEPFLDEARLNRPLKVAGYKLSQIGWDPGDPSRPGHEATDEQGRTVNQQRYTVLGVSTNAGIRLIFAGAVLACLGTPWAFYVKPWILRRRRDRLRRELARRHAERWSPASVAPSSPPQPRPDSGAELSRTP